MSGDNGSMPAYPGQVRQHGPDTVEVLSIGGLTKREYFAAMVLQGLAGNPGGPWQANNSNGWALTNCILADVAEVATDAADALLKQLERTNGGTA